jgi:soluble lytic murein transglycosylase
LKITKTDSLGGPTVETAGGSKREIFETPLFDLRLLSDDRLSSRANKKTQLSDTAAVDGARPSRPGPGEGVFSEALPLEAGRGAFLIKFGLRDFAIEELRSCEKKFSGNGDVLFLVSQLYWRNGLYRQAISLADRILKTRQGMDDPDRRFLERILYPVCYGDVVWVEARAQAIDPFLALAVIKKESAFDPAAFSSAGATGLMQLMPATATAIATYLGEDKQTPDMTNPRLNIRYGIWYLGRLVGRFSNSVVVALAAYNAGEDNAERWAAATGSKDAFVYTESVSYRETRDYIRRVLTDFQTYRLLYSR